jgi:hypothetical protein
MRQWAQTSTPTFRVGLQITIDFVVAILKEDRLAPVAAPGYKVRQSGDHDAGQSRYTETIAPAEWE